MCNDGGVETTTVVGWGVWLFGGGSGSVKAKMDRLLE